MNKIIHLIFLPITLTALLRHRIIILEKAETCPSNTTMAMTVKNLQLIHINKTHNALNMDLLYTRPLDDTIGVQMSLELQDSKGWRRIPFIPYQPKICNIMRMYYRENFVNFQRNMGIKNPGDCPVPAGNYSLRNFMVDLSALNVPIANGKFRTTVQTIDNRNRKVLQCLIFEVTIKDAE